MRAKRAQAVFGAVDILKEDLASCGMRLQEASRHFRLALLLYSGGGVVLRQGTGSARLAMPLFKGDKCLSLAGELELAPGQACWVYDLVQDELQQNRVASHSPEGVWLAERSSADFFAGSTVVGVREVEYRFFSGRRQLMRRMDGGPFRPFLADVSDFALDYFSESQSALFRIGMDCQERIRGFVSMVNLA